MQKKPAPASSRRTFLITLSGLAGAAAGCRTASPISDTPTPRSHLPSPISSQANIASPTKPFAIDTHIHLCPAVPNMKPSPPEMDRLFNGPPEELAQHLRQEMHDAGIGLAFAMGRLDGPETDPLGLQSTLRVAQLIPGIKGIGAIDPRRATRSHLHECERQLDREREHIVGLKAYLGYLHFAPSDPRFAPYYKLAAKFRLPVIFHTGDNWSIRAKLRYAHPLGVDDVAVDYPEVKFVLAHLGNPWLVDAAEVIYKNDNVWADLSGLYVGDDAAVDQLLKQRPLPEVASGVMIGEIKKALGYAERPDRLLYGTDWPLVAMPVYRRFLEAILPKEQHEAVFHKNAEALFNVSSKVSG